MAQVAQVKGAHMHDLGAREINLWFVFFPLFLLFRGYLRLFFLALVWVYLVFLVKFQVLDFLKGLLKVSFSFFGVRVYLYYICILRILRFI